MHATAFYERKLTDSLFRSVSSAAFAHGAKWIIVSGTAHHVIISSFCPRHHIVIIDLTLAAGSDRSGVFRVWVSVLQFAAVAFLL